MKLNKRLEKGIDVGGIGVALVVDLILNCICFVLLAPDWLTSIAFFSIGVMIVLFVFRSWARGQRIAWAVFVVVVFFFDLSFTLESTRSQSTRVDAATDTELAYYQRKAEESAAEVADLQAQYREAAKRETMDQLDARITVAKAEGKDWEAKRESRLAVINSTHGVRPPMTADSIFNAIPTAVVEGRLIPLAIFALIFLGLQLIIVTSISSDAPERVVLPPAAPAAPPPPPPPVKVKKPRAPRAPKPAPAPVVEERLPESLLEAPPVPPRKRAPANEGPGLFD